MECQEPYHFMSMISLTWVSLLRTSGLHVEFNLDVPGVELGGIVTRTLRG